MRHQGRFNRTRSHSLVLHAQKLFQPTDAAEMLNFELNMPGCLSRTRNRKECKRWSKQIS